jgi:hypothetical protein
MIGSQIGCTNLVEIPPAYGYITLWVSVFHQAWKSLTLIVLLQQMKKCAHFEFQRLVFPTTAYFIMDFISYTLAMFIYCFQSLQDQLQTQFIGLNLFMLLLFLLNVPHVIVGLSIVYLKDFKDPIQEISKLDYYYSVSIFQRKTIDRNSKSTLSSSVNGQSEEAFKHLFQMVSDDN